MGYLLMGHGGFDADPVLTPSATAIVGIPEGVTLQFYADAGQMLAYPMGADDVRDIWNRAQRPWDPLDHTNLVYNLTLNSAFQEWSSGFLNAGTCEGHTLIRPGVEVADPVRLCHGTPETCPTSLKEVARRKPHACDGILGLYGGEMHWLACTAFTWVGASEADTVAAATTGRQKSVRLGGLHPDWTPPADWTPDLDSIPTAHRTALDGAADGARAMWSMGGGLFLVNVAHDPLLVAYVSCQDDYAFGYLTVRRTGGPGNAAHIAVQGVPAAARDLVLAAVAEASTLDVYFTVR
ncbi:putative adhesin [Streptomyces erythrochromogenes]|uniref:putative adhesin n=1 Tax=Streptomyces erythrochromogenes TaxID=285574 RepID=UPI0034268087